MKIKLTHIYLLILLIINIYLIKVNQDIYFKYVVSKGKTRALFGLYLINYTYLIYLFIFELLLYIFSNLKNKNYKKTSYILLSTFLFLLSIILIFFHPWKWFI